MKEFEIEGTQPQKFFATDSSSANATDFEEHIREPAPQIASYSFDTRFVDMGGTHMTALDDW